MTLRYTVFGTLFLSLFPLSYNYGPIRFYTCDLFFIPLFFLFTLTKFQSKVVLNPTRNKRVKWYRGEKTFLFFFIGLVLTNLLTEHPTNSAISVSVWLRVIIFYVILRYLFAWKIISSNDVKKWWLIFLFVLILVGIIELFTDRTICIVARYFGENREEQYTFLETIRLSGTTPNANLYGDWLVLFSLAGTARIIGTKNHTPRKLLLAFFLNIFTLLVLLQTLSRGSLIFYLSANIFLFFFMHFQRYRNIRHSIVTNSFMLVIFALIGFSLFFIMESLIDDFLICKRFLSFEQSQRTDLIVLGFLLLKHVKVILFGTGSGAFFASLSEYGYGYDKIEIWKDLFNAGWGIHSAFLKILVEDGIFVFFLYVLFWVTFLKDIFQSIKNLDYPQLNFLLTYSAALMLAVIVVPLQLHTEVLNIEFHLFLTVIVAVVYHFKEHEKTVYAITVA